MAGSLGQTGNTPPAFANEERDHKYARSFRAGSANANGNGPAGSLYYDVDSENIHSAAIEQVIDEAGDDPLIKELAYAFEHATTMMTVKYYLTIRKDVRGRIGEVFAKELTERLLSIENIQRERALVNPLSDPDMNNDIGRILKIVDEKIHPSLSYYVMRHTLDRILEKIGEETREFHTSGTGILSSAAVIGGVVGIVAFETIRHLAAAHPYAHASLDELERYQLMHPAAGERDGTIARLTSEIVAALNESGDTLTRFALQRSIVRHLAVVRDEMVMDERSLPFSSFGELQAKYQGTDIGRALTDLTEHSFPSPAYRDEAINDLADRIRDDRGIRSAAGISTMIQDHVQSLTTDLYDARNQWKNENEELEDESSEPEVGSPVRYAQQQDTRAAGSGVVGVASVGQSGSAPRLESMVHPGGIGSGIGAGAQLTAAAALYGATASVEIPLSMPGGQDMAGSLEGAPRPAQAQKSPQPLSRVSPRNRIEPSEDEGSRLGFSQEEPIDESDDVTSAVPSSGSVSTISALPPAVDIPKGSTRANQIRGQARDWKRSMASPQASRVGLRSGTQSGGRDEGDALPATIQDPSTPSEDASGQYRSEEQGQLPQRPVRRQMQPRAGRSGSSERGTASPRPIPSPLPEGATSESAGPAMTSAGAGMPARQSGLDRRDQSRRYPESGQPVGDEGTETGEDDASVQEPVPYDEGEGSEDQQPVRSRVAQRPASEPEPQPEQYDPFMAQEVGSDTGLQPAQMSTEPTDESEQDAGAEAQGQAEGSQGSEQGMDTQSYEGQSASVAQGQSSPQPSDDDAKRREFDEAKAPSKKESAAKEAKETAENALKQDLKKQGMKWLVKSVWGWIVTFIGSILTFLFAPPQGFFTIAIICLLIIYLMQDQLSWKEVWDLLKLLAE